MIGKFTLFLVHIDLITNPIFIIYFLGLENRREPNYLSPDMLPKHIYGGFVSQETVIRCGSNPIDRLYSMQASYFCNNISDDANLLQLDENQ